MPGHHRACISGRGRSYPRAGIGHLFHLTHTPSVVTTSLRASYTRYTILHAACLPLRRPQVCSGKGYLPDTTRQGGHQAAWLFAKCPGQRLLASLLPSWWVLRLAGNTLLLLLLRQGLPLGNVLVLVLVNNQAYETGAQCSLTHSPTHSGFQLHCSTSPYMGWLCRGCSVGHPDAW